MLIIIKNNFVMQCPVSTFSSMRHCQTMYSSLDLPAEQQSLGIQLLHNIWYCKDKMTYIQLQSNLDICQTKWEKKNREISDKFNLQVNISTFIY